MSPFEIDARLSSEISQTNESIINKKRNIMNLVALLVPIFVCVVLPVAIVLIIAIARINTEKQRANVLIKAIETNNGIDADKLAEAFKKPVKTAREILNQRLLLGCIFTFIGIFLAAIGIYNFATLSADINNDSAVIPSIFGGISLAIGISYLVVYFVTRKQIDTDDKE